jgi:hypothetical protein
VFLRLLWIEVGLRVLVNMALAWGNDGGGIGDLVDRRRRSTL